MEKNQNESDSDDSFQGVDELGEAAKEQQIQNAYSQNYKKVLENFQKYCELRIPISKLLSKMTSFEVKLDKVKKSNQYDIKEINCKTNLIVNITKLQQTLLLIKNNIVLGQKAITASRSDKQTASIRQLQKIQPCNKVIDQLLIETKKLIQLRIVADADKKTQQWVEQSRKQHIEMGKLVLGNCEQMLIQSAQFGRVSLFSPDTRSSIVMRTSCVNQRQSVLRTSVVRQSTIRQSINQSAPRQSFFQQFNQNPRNSVIDTQQSLQNIKQTINEASVWEFYVDFSQLKQPQLIYETLNLKLNFYQQLKSFRVQFLEQLCGDDLTYNIIEFRIYLSSILGFILMDIEISKAFKDYEDMSQIVIEHYKAIKTQIKKAFQSINLNDLLLAKKELQLFSLALAKLQQFQVSNQVNKTLNDQFIVFSNRRIEQITQELNKTIRADTGVSISVDGKDVYDQLCTILQISGTMNKRTNRYELPISYFVQEVINSINQFIEGSIQYLQNLNDYYDENVIFYLDALFTHISDVFKNYVQGNQDFMLIAQATLNLKYIENSISYYRKQVENLLQNARYFCEEAMQATINQRINIPPFDWSPEVPNKGPHDCFLIINGYYESILSTLQVFVPSFVDSSIYLTFKLINEQLWKALSETKHFNTLGLVNLEIDLNSFLRVCNVQQFPESIREFTQFLNLFLRDSPIQFLDANKRQNNYNYLVSQKLLKILPKYKKIEYGKYQVVRKRDVDTVLKKIIENPQAY